MEFYQEVERALTKEYRKKIWRPFLSALKDYRLVNDGDRIAVCISGGKDSMLLAKCMQELKRHSPTDFTLTFLCMDPGYAPRNRQKIVENAEKLNIPIEFFETDIFSSVAAMDGSPCYMCAKMRRGYLYREAQRRGCNKIALGHHYDDVVETILMSMIYGAQMQSMMPKLHSIHFDRMEVIRPMYLIREADIIHWRDYNDLHFIQCACRFTDTCTTCRPDGTCVSKRMEVKKMIAEMKKTNPYVEGNIFRSMENVNLDTVIGYKQHGVRHSFLEGYNFTSFS